MLARQVVRQRGKAGALRIEAVALRAPLRFFDDAQDVLAQAAWQRIEGSFQRPPRLIHRRQPSRAFGCMMGVVMIARLVILATLFALVVPAGILVANPVQTHGDTDLSGDWVFLFGPVVGPGKTPFADFLCIASLVQDGSIVTGSMSCGGDVFLSLMGSVSDDGSITITTNFSGTPTVLTGALGEYGFGGTYSPSTHVYPTFLGTRGSFGRGVTSCPRTLGDTRLASSLDAAVILQYTAGLTQLPCRYLADANVDGAVTATDAFLVLEYTAGIIDQFTPP